MAVVILGGLFTSTLLNLLVLPVLYEKFGGAVTVAAEEEDTEAPSRDGVVASATADHAVRPAGSGVP
jgi:hypothetical protein